MLFPDRIAYTMGGAEVEIPRVFRARQIFERSRLEDVGAAARAELDRLPLPDLRGKRVALTAGSRGVANMARILRAVADWLKEKGAQPFIVPAMGSHGGATAEGQKALIAGYGVTEEAMGVPILSSMDTVLLGTTASGFPVHCDRNAAEADCILPVHRVKAHTDFKGDIESGLCKMLVIGLGKHRGASHIHNLGFAVFPQRIPEAAGVALASGKIPAGLALVENAYEETMLIEGVPAPRFVEREKELLVLAKRVAARFHVDAIDLLVVEEIGKDISGAGMDCNITGYPTSLLPGFDRDTCPIGRIAVLGISALSHGNGIGMGMAHLVTVDFMKQLDLAGSYINSITSRMLEGSRMPVVANHDLDAVRLGLYCGMIPDMKQAKVVQIANTLRLSEILLSEAYLPLVRGDARFEILSEPEPMRFDGAGRLERIGGGGR